MKEIKYVAIGGKNIAITDDAHAMLAAWLDNFRARVEPASQAPDVMKDIEERVGELFTDAAAGAHNYVVDTDLAQKVIARLGMPDGSDPGVNSTGWSEEKPDHRFYRDPDDKKIGGICSGLALYFGVDTSIIRIIALLLLICYGCGFWAYIIVWFIVPLADSPLQKCELRGIRPTAENLRRYSKTI